MRRTLTFFELKPHHSPKRSYGSHSDRGLYYQGSMEDTLQVSAFLLGRWTPFTKKLSASDIERHVFPERFKKPQRFISLTPCKETAENWAALGGYDSHMYNISRPKLGSVQVIDSIHLSEIYHVAQIITECERVKAEQESVTLMVLPFAIKDIIIRGENVSNPLYLPKSAVEVARLLTDAFTQIVEKSLAGELTTEKLNDYIETYVNTYNDVLSSASPMQLTISQLQEKYPLIKLTGLEQYSKNTTLGNILLMDGIKLLMNGPHPLIIKDSPSFKARN